MAITEAQRQARRHYLGSRMEIKEPMQTNAEFDEYLKSFDPAFKRMIESEEHKMRATLDYLLLEHFQGAEQQRIEFGGRSASVTAQNGSGKTRLKNAFLWLMFDKDSQDAKAFSNRTLVTNEDSPDCGQPVKGLICAVEAGLRMDGVLHVLRKEEPEKVSKHGDVSYPRSYWIDEVPQLQNKFKAWVESEIIGEDAFKMLTNLEHFLGTLPWEQVRGVLKDFGCVTGHPEGFQELLDEMKGRKIKDYQKVIRDRKKGHEKERDAIPAKIQENQRTFKGYAENMTESEPELQGKRDLKKTEIANIEAERTELRHGEAKRIHQQADLAGLKGKMATREGELAGDTSAVKGLLDEKLGIETAYMEQMHSLTGLQADLRGKGTLRGAAQAVYDGSMRHIQNIRQNHQSLTEQPEIRSCPSGDKCPFAQDTKDAAGLHQSILDEVIKAGDAAKLASDDAKVKVDNLSADINLLVTAYEKAETDLRDKEAGNKKRFAEIEAEVKACPRPKPENDYAWVQLDVAIKNLETQIGPPATDQMENIEARLKTANAELDALKDALRNFDQIAGVKARIAYLGEQETNLGQRIADCDKELCRIDSYVVADGDRIAEAIKGKFKHITWRLHEQQLNGGIVPCCVAVLGGRPYHDMSGGEKIFAGLDAVRALMKHYALWPPLFVDNRQNMTLPLDIETQTIELRTMENVAELQVELLEEQERAVA